MAWLKLADYGIEWKHLYVASLTIDMVNHCTKKLLSIRIPLSHMLCFLNLSLYATAMILFLLQKVDVHGALPYVADLSPCQIFA